MRKILYGLIALLCLSGTANASFNVFDDKYEIWGEVCEDLAHKYSCFGLRPPQIEVVDLKRRGLNGLYKGGDTVYLSHLLFGDRFRSTLYHEMVHYLQKWKGGVQIPGPAKTVCAAEEEAFLWTDRFNRRIGRFDLVRGGKWWQPYWYCHRWYADDLQ